MNEETGGSSGATMDRERRASFDATASRERRASFDAANRERRGSGGSDIMGIGRRNSRRRDSRSDAYDPRKAALPVCFELVGPNIELVDGALGARKTAFGDGLVLAAPVVRSGHASVTFRLNSTPTMWAGHHDVSLGVFPADQEDDP